MEITPRETPAPETIVEIEHLSRPEAIARLRERLRSFSEKDHCVCETVGRLGVFCGGFKRLSDAEFNKKFQWIVVRHRNEPRQSLEALASLYHEGRQEATGAAICCDIETKEHGGCDGWNQFHGEALERFHLAMIGSPIKVG
jgi:hypothetical protein